MDSTQYPLSLHEKLQNASRPSGAKVGPMKPESESAHLGATGVVAQLVTLRWPVPLAFITQMSRSRLKATRRPSADQAGSLSLDAPVVSCLSCVPSAFTTQMSPSRPKAITPVVPGKAANAGEA